MPDRPDLHLVTSAPPSRDDPATPNDLVQAIQGDVLSGRLKPDQRVRAEELRQRYEAGIGAIREALAHLAAIGVVRGEPGKGFRIAPASIADLEDITRLRVEFERQAIAESIASGDDRWEADIVAAFHLLSRMPVPDARAEPRLWKEWSNRHKRFHDALAGACTSPWLQHFRSVLFDHSQRYRSMDMEIRAGASPRMPEHREMMEAVLARDTARACAAVEAHIRKTCELARKALEPRPSTAAGKKAARRR